MSSSGGPVKGDHKVSAGRRRVDEVRQRKQRFQTMKFPNARERNPRLRPRGPDGQGKGRKGAVPAYACGTFPGRGVKDAQLVAQMLAARAQQQQQQQGAGTPPGPESSPSSGELGPGPSPGSPSPSPPSGPAEQRKRSGSTPPTGGDRASPSRGSGTVNVQVPVSSTTTSTTTESGGVSVTHQTTTISVELPTDEHGNLLPEPLQQLLSRLALSPAPSPKHRADSHTQTNGTNPDPAMIVPRPLRQAAYGTPPSPVAAAPVRGPSPISRPRSSSSGRSSRPPRGAAVPATSSASSPGAAGQAAGVPMSNAERQFYEDLARRGSDVASLLLQRDDDLKHSRLTAAAPEHGGGHGGTGSGSHRSSSGSGRWSGGSRRKKSREHHEFIRNLIKKARKARQKQAEELRSMPPVYNYGDDEIRDIEERRARVRRRQVDSGELRRANAVAPRPPSYDDDDDDDDESEDDGGSYGYADEEEEGGGGDTAAHFYGYAAAGSGGGSGGDGGASDGVRDWRGAGGSGGGGGGGGGGAFYSHRAGHRAPLAHAEPQPPRMPTAPRRFWAEATPAAPADAPPAADSGVPPLDFASVPVTVSPRREAKGGGGSGGGGNVQPAVAPSSASGGVSPDRMYSARLGPSVNSAFHDLSSRSAHSSQSSGSYGQHMS